METREMNLNLSEVKPHNEDSCGPAKESIWEPTSIRDKIVGAFEHFNDIHISTLRFSGVLSGSASSWSAELWTELEQGSLRRGPNGR
jgi:hypothetical protein